MLSLNCDVVILRTGLTPSPSLNNIEKYNIFKHFVSHHTTFSVMLNFQLLKNDSNQQGNGSQMAVKAASSKSPFVAKVWQFVNLLVSFSACASWSLSVCLKWNWMTFIDKLLQVLGSDDLLFQFLDGTSQNPLD